MGSLDLDGGTAADAASPPQTPQDVNHIAHAPGVSNTARSLTSQHTVAEWKQIATINAFGGQTLQPATGFTSATRSLLVGLYTYYGSLNKKMPTKFNWAGLAKLAGGQVVSGLDLAAIPVIFSGPSGDADSIQIIVTALSVFDDIAWQFEAYAAAGVGELRALLPDYDAKNPAANAQTFPFMPAWELIDKDGDPAVEGSRLLLQHEQKVCVQNGFDHLAENFFTNRARAVLECPHPYGRSFIVSMPGGEVRKIDDRWSWVTTEVWSRWIPLPPEETRRLIDLDFSDIVARNFAKTGPLLPQFLPPGDGGEDDD